MKRKLQAGFTILEIMLVIVLVSLLASAVAPRIAGISRVGVQSSVRRYTGLIRYAYDNAVLTGRVHRIVLDLDNQTWRIEAAEPGLLPSEKIKEELKTNLTKEELEKAKADSPYKRVAKNLVDKIPNGVTLVQFESWRIGRDVAATKGEGYIYAYPSGFIDQATVVLAQSGKEKVQNFRITTRSLTGRVDVEVETDGKVEK